MTFETPGQRGRLHLISRLPGRAGSLRLLGGGGSLAVTAARVHADTPADAAMAVVNAVQQRWTKTRGPLQMRSWTAHRERVLLGSRRSSSWSADRPHDDGSDGDEGGTAGVREPRRPLPGPGSLHAEQELPGPT